jgi:hypothetical protein
MGDVSGLTVGAGGVTTGGPTIAGGVGLVPVLVAAVELVTVVDTDPTPSTAHAWTSGGPPAPRPDWSS